MTDWLEALKRECLRTSQNKTAKRLGVSSAMVSQVLNGVYKGNIDTLKGRVKGELMGQKVDCPVLGNISCMKCLKNRELPFAATNPQRVRLYKACRDNCQHSKHRGIEND